jgi:SAM-dependent methyltransferase
MNQQMDPIALYEAMHTRDSYRLNNQGLLLWDMWRNRIKPTSSILEVGCGNGLLCKKLVKEGFDVTGVDIVSGDYDREGYKFIEGDFNNLKSIVDPKGYDALLSFDVIEHLEEEVDKKELFKTLSSISKNPILAICCCGGYPLHLSVHSPGYWLDVALDACPKKTWVAKAFNRHQELGNQPVVLLIGEEDNGSH